MVRAALLSLSVLLVGESVATATLVTYAVNHSFAVTTGGTGDISIAGTVTVDDSGGDITETSELGQITNWNLTFSNPGGAEGPITINPTNSGFGIAGNATIEITPTELIWNVPTQVQSSKSAAIFLIDQHGPSDPKQQWIDLRSFQPGFSTEKPLQETFRIEHNSGDATVAMANETFVNQFVFGVVAAVPEPGVTAVALLSFVFAGTVGRRA